MLKAMIAAEAIPVATEPHSDSSDTTVALIQSKEAFGTLIKLVRE